jgi:hypothetical protein
MAGGPQRCCDEDTADIADRVHLNRVKSPVEHKIPDRKMDFTALWSATLGNRPEFG